jgi:hypothetical protein
VSRAALDTVLYLMDEAFRGPGIEASNEAQALLPNLATVTDAIWRMKPLGVVRSIEAITIHVGACKVMYDDYAFGDGTLRFGEPPAEPFPDGRAPKDEVIAWVTESHQRLVDHTAALADDAELRKPRLTNWGERRETRWILSTMLQHDVYHAGEINHLRSQLLGDDRWRWQQQGFGS